MRMIIARKFLLYSKTWQKTESPQLRIEIFIKVLAIVEGDSLEKSLFFGKKKEIQS